jgi:AraC-like DNA-binding protein
MARPNKELPSRSAIVPAAVRYAGARGVDVEALVLRFSLATSVARADEVVVDGAVPNELLRAVAVAVAQDDVALHVAAALSTRRETLVGLAVRASRDVGQALRALARWVPLLQDDLEASLLDGDEAGGRFVLATPGRPRGAGRFVHELVLARALHLVRQGVADAAIERLWFAHARPPNLEAVEAWFGSRELSFGQEDSGLAFTRAQLRRPMPHADTRTVEAIAPLLDAELGAHASASLADRVGRLLASSLPAGADIADVAAALHVSARTLQRRLEQEGTRYSDVLDGARLAQARRLLADPAVTLTDAAFRLGFSDLATFSRAFKRWTGKPPGQWRRS